MEGYGWSREGTPDVFAVCGKNPGIVGFDFQRVLDGGPDTFNFYLEKVKNVYDRGGIVTFSWHMRHPISGGDSLDNDRVIEKILPRGQHHQRFKTVLDQFAVFVKQAIGSDGKKIPIIFRPYHEHTGSWFWWRAKRDGDNFIKLWRFTVDHFKNHHRIHNLLYAYSPAKFHRRIRRYFVGYPGDHYVDIFGLDYYSEHMNDFADELGDVAEEARKRHKIVALTETGEEGIRFQNYWTHHFLNVFKNNRRLRDVAYVVFWRNAAEREEHYFVPYPGHVSVPNFLAMAQDRYSIFQEDFPHSVYQQE